MIVTDVATVHVSRLDHCGSRDVGVHVRVGVPTAQAAPPDEAQPKLLMHTVTIEAGDVPTTAGTIEPLDFPRRCPAASDTARN